MEKEKMPVHRTGAYRHKKALGIVNNTKRGVFNLK